MTASARHVVCFVDFMFVCVSRSLWRHCDPRRRPFAKPCPLSSSRVGARRRRSLRSPIFPPSALRPQSPPRPPEAHPAPRRDSCAPSRTPGSWRRCKRLQRRWLLAAPAPRREGEGVDVDIELSLLRAVAHLHSHLQAHGRCGCCVTRTRLGRVNLYPGVKV